MNKQIFETYDMSKDLIHLGGGEPLLRKGTHTFQVTVVNAYDDYESNDKYIITIHNCPLFPTNKEQIINQDDLYLWDIYHHPLQKHKDRIEWWYVENFTTGLFNGLCEICEIIQIN